MVVHRATDAVPDRRIVLPLVDEYRRRLRERETDIRRHDGEMRLVVELIAGGGALACGRGLPNCSSAFKGNRDGDAWDRLEKLVQLVIDDAAAVGRCR